MDTLWIELLVFVRRLPHANSDNISLNPITVAPESVLKTHTSMKMSALLHVFQATLRMELEDVLQLSHKPDVLILTS